MGGHPNTDDSSSEAALRACHCSPDLIVYSFSTFLLPGPRLIPPIVQTRHSLALRAWECVAS